VRRDFDQQAANPIQLGIEQHLAIIVRLGPCSRGRTPQQAAWLGLCQEPAQEGLAFGYEHLFTGLPGIDRHDGQPLGFWRRSIPQAWRWAVRTHLGTIGWNLRVGLHHQLLSLTQTTLRLKPFLPSTRTSNLPAISPVHLVLHVARLSDTRLG
jgi:hypothetical protein